jgi:hypothetical protein
MTTRSAQVMFGLALLLATPAGAAELARNEWRPIRIGAPPWTEDSEAFVRFESGGGLSRPQSDRIVLRAGCQIDTTRPDYRELDEALAGGAS